MSGTVADWDADRCDDACSTHLLTQTHTQDPDTSGVAYMAQWLYPDLFADLGPYSIHQHLERFQGMGLPDRIFVYPASEP